MTGAARTEYYGDYWRAPELEHSEHLRWKIEATRHKTRVRAARSVLDVGCGSGAVLAAIADAGKRLCGVEMSSEAVAALRARGIEGHAVDLEGGRLPFADGEFEVVLCFDVLEHVFAPERLLAEIRRVLADDGAALLCVPNTLNLFNRLVFLSGRFVDVMDTSHRSGELFSNHLRLFNKDLFERLLDGGGFRVAQREFYFPARFSDPGVGMPSSLARLVTLPRLHERLPTLFAMGFFYTCEKARRAAL